MTARHALGLCASRDSTTVSALMKRTFNKKLFLWLLCGTIVFGAAIHGIHILQAKQTASGLLRQAAEAEEKKDWRKAADYLGRYLQFAPEDTDALARFGFALDKQGDKNPRLRERALLVFDQVLRRDPERADVRQEAVKLAMSLGRFADAKAHLDVLLAANLSDGELWYSMGTCEAGEGKFKEEKVESGGQWKTKGAVASFNKAIQYSPKKIESYVFLATIQWRQLQDTAASDQVMNALVKENQSIKARLARAVYWRERGKAEIDLAKKEIFLEREGDDIAAARAMAPDDATVMLETAEWWLAQIQQDGGRHNKRLHETARMELERGLGLHPREPRMYLSLSRLETMAGRTEQAIACLQQGRKALPEGDQAEVLFALADLLIDQGSLGAADEVMARLKREAPDSPPVQFLEACLLVKKGEWQAATNKLEQKRKVLASWPGLASRSNYLLGQCYEQLGDADQQYAAYRRALSSDPFSIAATHGMGRALVAMGKLAEAIQAYRSLVPRAPQAKTFVVRLLVRRNLGLPKNEQDWNEVDALLKELEEVNRQSPPTAVTEIYLLQAEAAAGRDNFKDAQERLVKAKDVQELLLAEDAQRTNVKDKKANPEAWIALANLASLQKLHDQALTILQEAKDKFGDRAELRLAFAWHWARDGGKEARQALAQLTEDNFERFDIEAKHRLLREFTKIYRLLGELARAEKMLLRLEKSQPHNLKIKQTLFEIALETGNAKAAEVWKEDMRRIEGKAGTYWRCANASLLIWRANKTGDKKGLDEAQTLLSALAGEREGWPRVWVCQGQLQELLGKKEGAIKCYLKAIDLGEFNLALSLHTLNLLYNTDKMEAAKVLQKLPEQIALLGEFKYMAVDLLLQSQDYKHALTLAEKAVKDGPDDYRNYLWLAQVYLAMDKKAEAEPLLRQAVAKKSSAPEAWLALVRYLMFTGQEAKADDEIGNAKKNLPPELKALAMGQCYELINKFKEAKEWYQQALDSQPNDVPTLKSMSQLCFRLGQLQDAEVCLQRIIAQAAKHPEAAAAAKEILTLVRFSSGKNYKERQDALDAGQAGDPGVETIDRLRTKALALAALPYVRDHRAAIRILEKMRDRQPLTANDQFLLAQLYESVKEWPKAHAELVALVNKDGKNLLYLTRLAQGLLRNRETDAVEPLLAKLEELYPTASATLDIKVRLLAAQGKGQKVVELLTQYAEKNEDKLLPVALLLEELKQPKAAEDVLRQYVAKSKVPESPLVLAQFLGRQEGRLDEALELCQKAVPTCRAETIAKVCLTILYKAKPSKDQCQRVEQMLTAALQKERTAILLDYLGAFHNLQGDFPAAEADFRAVLKLEPKDLTALNNLSWLLAFQLSKNAEALKLVKSAIEIGGPHAGLLDTRGVIHLTAGRAADALKDLEDAVAETPSPSHYFHLAQAHYLAKNNREALAAWTAADELGLTEQSLHRLERDAYHKLCVDLGVQKK